MIKVLSLEKEESHMFQIESLKKVDYFQARFSERWDFGEDCILKASNFQMQDMIVLIEQIIEQGSINTREVHYNNLPSIVACADFLSYKIDENIFLTFMCDCIPTIPWLVCKNWQHPDRLASAATKFLEQDRRISAEKEKTLLVNAIQNRRWGFTRMFIRSEVILEVFKQEMNARRAVDLKGWKLRFLWKLISEKDDTSLWADPGIMQAVVDVMSGVIMTESYQVMWTEVAFPILLSIIEWGLTDDKRFLAMPQEHQNINFYIKKCLDITLKYLSIGLAKTLIELSIKYSCKWKTKCTYTTGLLISQTLELCRKDEPWLVKILEHIDNTSVCDALFELLSAMNNGIITDQRLLNVIKQFFDV
ncbi:hypothetical protein RFI_17916 [Reticulomyxa filosa]|uniref:Uncharacterized protein n=1 Tax=Reticulomyxa filosa TaxID=46433 RepID=X6N093_RETFI|nr:hypothetical protein RFI_17916 [Reticulomyxa filosa]|eukprot:ETO19313.1 hypothetical protein RFI_17916 [Reticulomyxa filosa]